MAPPEHLTSASPASAGLDPAAVLAWRSPGRLQVGLGPRAVVLEGLSADDEAALATLQAGTGTAVSEHLAEALGASGALLDPSRRHRRARAVVVVCGASTTGLAVATGLAASGVGTVVTEDDAPLTDADVGPGGHPAHHLGMTRGRSAALHLSAAVPGTATRLADAGRVRPDVVVLLASGAHDARRSEALLREDVVHLGVLLHGRDATVGPLVRPGTSCCLRCLDLHRTDRDPEWPLLLPQLSGPPGGPRRPEVAATAALAAALAVQQVLAHLDGDDEPAALGATVEVDAGGGVGVRPWSPHPRCGCTWASGRADRGSAGAGWSGGRA